MHDVVHMRSTLHGVSCALLLPPAVRMVDAHVVRG
jgi:hypothetical protein